ncbi:MAG: hypothetical protein QM778_19985 [Myxococcales bacterium]
MVAASVRAFFRVARLAPCLGLLAACTGPKREAPARREPPKAAPLPAFSGPTSSLERPPVEVPAQLDYLIFGGGSEPLSNQISLAQDLNFARELLDGRGLTLFASGPNAPVSVEDRRSENERPDLTRELARMFGVPGADATRYEAAPLSSDGPSTADQVLHALEKGLSHGKEPLFVYAACHGDQGAQPADNTLSLWGGWGLKVTDLTAVLDRHEDNPRGTRFVITACFGGGFAELAFVAGDPKRGARSPEHCGLFAAPWDEEASGCDPNPDRRVQESYSIHFMHALAGQDRRQHPRMHEIDLNGDQRVSLLEAHTYARIASRSFDTPTTTSERYLREVSPNPGRATPRVALDPLAAPEEVAIVRALGEELELSSEAEAKAKLSELDGILTDANQQVSKAQQTADDAYYALRIALLERFPLLEHPWEQRGRDLIAQQAVEISKLLTESDLAQEHVQASHELDQAVIDQDSVRVARARVQRLVRAYETLRLATALKKKSGPDYTHFAALRRCENWVPRLRSGGRP